MAEKTPYSSGTKPSEWGHVQIIPISLPFDLVKRSQLTTGHIKLSMASVLSTLYYNFGQPLRFDPPEQDIHDPNRRFSVHAEDAERIFSDLLTHHHPNASLQDKLPNKGNWTFNLHHQLDYNGRGVFSDQLVSNASPVAIALLEVYCEREKYRKELTEKYGNDINGLVAELDVKDQTLFVKLYAKLREIFA